LFQYYSSHELLQNCCASTHTHTHTRPPQILKHSNYILP
jgi:hypothetical protein